MSIFAPMSPYLCPHGSVAQFEVNIGIPLAVSFCLELLWLSMIFYINLRIFFFCSVKKVIGCWLLKLEREWAACGLWVSLITCKWHAAHLGAHFKNYHHKAECGNQSHSANKQKNQGCSDNSATTLSTLHWLNPLTVGIWRGDSIKEIFSTWGASPCANSERQLLAHARKEHITQSGHISPAGMTYVTAFPKVTNSI